jgi:hypothetical protein
VTLRLGRRTAPAGSDGRGTLGLLVGCLLLAVPATAMGLPTVIRVLVGVPGLLLAPGFAWLSTAARTAGTPARTLTGLVLAGVLSLAALALTGVAVYAAGLPVTPMRVAVGLVVVTLPPAVWCLRPGGRTADVRRTAPGRRRRRRGLLVVLSVGLFVAAVAWGASWQARVDSGPFDELSYAGELAHLDGPVDVQSGEVMSLPVTLGRSDGQPWAGSLSVTVDGQPQQTRSVDVPAGQVVTLQVTAPAAAGLHDVVVTGVREATSTPLLLTLRLQVAPR